MSTGIQPSANMPPQTAAASTSIPTSNVSGYSLAPPPSPPPPPPPPSYASTPLRESQVAAAVTFLQNPKVTNTSAARRVSFLDSKGLAPNEIVEAFRRANPAGEEYRTLADGVARGKTPLEAIAVIDTTTPLAAPPVVSTSAPAPAPYPYYPPYAYAPPPPPPPPPPFWDWKTIILSAASAIGLGSTAYLLSKDHLPTVKLEYNQQSTPQQATTAVPLPASVRLLPAASSAENDPFISDVITSSTDEAEMKSDGGVVRSLNELKSEVSDMCELIRAQTAEQKRVSMAIQSALDVIAKERKDTAIHSLQTDVAALRSLIQPSAIDGAPVMNGIHTRNATMPTSYSPATLSTADVVEEKAPSNQSEPSSMATPDAAQLPAEYHAQALSSLRAAITVLTSAPSNTENLVTLALSTLNLYIGNLLQQIDQTRYRQIRTSNTGYQTRIRAVKGAELFLTAAGFISKGQNIMEWERETVGSERDLMKIKILNDAKELIAQTQTNIANGTIIVGRGNTANNTNDSSQPAVIVVEQNGIANAVPLSTPTSSDTSAVVTNGINDYSDTTMTTPLLLPS